MFSGTSATPALNDYMETDALGGPAEGSKPDAPLSRMPSGDGRIGVAARGSCPTREGQPHDQDRPGALSVEVPRASREAEDAVRLAARAVEERIVMMATVVEELARTVVGEDRDPLSQCRQLITWMSAEFEWSATEYRLTRPRKRPCGHRGASLCLCRPLASATI